jgi:orotate phosphoribosyltransferase
VGNREQIVDLVRRLGLEHRDEPFTLTSGETSQDYIDGKRAIAHGSDLRLAADASVQALGGVGVTEFDAVGGLTMGADPLAHAIAIVAQTRWFSVRKQPKGHGTQRFVEGATLDSGARVVLVDDVVTTGGSIQQAFHALDELDVVVLGALTLVDRGDVARRFFDRRRVPYVALVTYSDLQIPPVGAGP